ncbi:uncharacterized protein LOC121965946, partial [Plectropomus leopardus]|uniref:uncharacterized protein LOC121965946 n=1 Tax=Plectropomus leopardus TaxID=160734 RepID=UPI001C4B8419
SDVLRLVARCPADPPVAPTLFALSPLPPEGTSADSPGPDVCLATDFRPKVGTLVLNLRDGPVNVSTSNAVLSTKKKTYFYATFTNQTLHSCELYSTPGNNEIIDLCADVHPDKSKVNFFLLVMNGVRVVFTKTLALNTLLTIRAVLF